MHKVLYVSTNDGSDMRVTKEVASLSKHAEVHFLGVGKISEKNFVKKYCSVFKLVEGKRNTFSTILKHIYLFLRFTWTNKYDSVHFINEQTLIFFYPFIFRKYVVLDLFDSIFLTLNKPGNKLNWLKILVYAPVDCILVTDENRYNLLNDYSRKKAVVLPNFPLQVPHYEKRQPDNKVVILYNGTMNIYRGTELIAGLLERDPDIKVIMAGWITDKQTREIGIHPNVKFIGVVKQDEALQIAARDADYILCVYAPITDNNINASPNKIYDAIQCNTPVIINREIKVSGFVAEHGLGILLDSYYNIDFDKLISELHRKKGSWNFDPALKSSYNWEAVEPVLLKAHKIVD